MKSNITFLSLIFLLILTMGCADEKNEVEEAEDSDGFTYWLKQSRDETLELSVRKKALLKAYEIDSITNTDSVRLKNLRKIAYQTNNLGDTLLFRKVNPQVLLGSEKLNDSLGIADAHWNYGTFYVKKAVYDSAYSHYHTAKEYYSALRNDYYSGKMLYNMAFIKGRLKDYTGSEVLIFQAIAKFERLDKYKSLYTSYNYLAVIYKELEEYDRAHYYNDVALNYLEKIENKETLYEGTLNNVGLIFHNEKKYDKAIEYFNKALEKDNLKDKNIELYARLLDNKAHSRLLNNDTVNLLKEFSESLHIRDSLNNHSGIVLNKLHLAEFFKNKKDTTRAIQYATEAKELAKEIRNNSDYLASLKFLSQTDKNKSTSYMVEFMQVNDSLQSVERKIRDKFTRIDFETNQYREKAERLLEEKILLLVVSISLVIVLILLYFINQQYSKRKDLQFESAGQKANEQIYLMTLKQQTKLQEGKTLERNRISEELHDGVLGKLFGTRVGLGFLNLKMNESESTKYNSFIGELQLIEKEIRDISHELKNNVAYSSSLGFFTLVNNLLRDKSEIGGFNYKLNKDETVLWDHVDDLVKTNLYRIIQESLQNVIKYAQAKNVTVDFLNIDGNLKLTIIDDGVGFNSSKKKRGIGLKNLKSRTKNLYGVFEIESEQQKGTKITVTVPINIKK